MTVYYNEFDPAAAYALRELIARGVIAPGVVDERSIADVQPDDLRGFTQCHFFAGGGLWSVGARLAGWRDDKPIWSGSCPCQPYSGAGKRLGDADPRNLWPHFYRLIAACRPPIVVGEQVGKKAGYGWFDGVRSDLESQNYACRAVDIPACAINSPQERNRLFWLAVADTDGARLSPSQLETVLGTGRGQEGRAAECGNGAHGNGDVANGASQRPGEEGRFRHNKSAQRLTGDDDPWRDYEWITCHDGKARRAKPGIPMLVDGFPGRVDIWRIAGNAIVPQLAAEVLRAWLDEETESAVAALGF